MTLASCVKRKAAQLGFVSCGVIAPITFDEYAEFLDERVKGFPESQELYQPLYGITRLPPAAKSIIVCVRRYNQYRIPDHLNGRIGKLYLFDGRVPYSHESRNKAEFEAYLDTLGIHVIQAGVPARWAAAKAGLGTFGNNNFIYHAEHGSYIWIDTWVVDRELDCDPPVRHTFSLACNSCEKCVRACPTKALSDRLSMDRGKCIAQLSFYAKDILEEDVRSQMGLWQYGCDVCQDVCPINKDLFIEAEDFPLLSEFEEYLRPENLLGMDENTYAKVINPRFWYAGKDALWLWKCNALRSMINSKDAKYKSIIQRCSSHEDHRIKEIAAWGCAKLNI